MFRSSYEWSSQSCVRKFMKIGVIDCRFAIVFSEIVDLYYQPAAQIRSDVRYWIAGFIGLGILACFINIFQAGMFGYAGEKLTMRLRSMAFKVE
jgi:ATP-binding cassette subfamily B (MDR/TAP) protein 1